MRHQALHIQRSRNSTKAYPPPKFQDEEDRREPGAREEEPGVHGGHVRGGLQKSQQNHRMTS